MLNFYILDVLNNCWHKYCSQYVAWGRFPSTMIFKITC